MTCDTCSELERRIDLASRYHDGPMKATNSKKLHAHRREAHP